ncbi:thioesterase family protein [Psychrobacter sp. NG27]|uniref:thioesterase family protein n=1 Tax=Psychrobacter sp. NG27 TaxID=2781966 RepID=UPI0018DFE603|nr:thioesterase family protein [Psychrobacter sp. NG27]MBI0426703.1 thioesterase family protein [Psychrobacter sp. NG27]
MTAYYKFIKREQPLEGVIVAHYQPTFHAQGAWNEHEQHMAPATGLLTAELSGFAPQANMRIARVSLDILGLIPLGDFTITTRCIRPGKTIELIESVMSSRGRDAIIARAWRLMTQDTSEIAGLEDQTAQHKPEDLPVWDDMKGWPGGFIKSVRLVAEPDRRPGCGMVWITNDVDMIEGVPTGDVVHLLGMVDTANGVVPRLGLGLSKLEWMFPNTDLQIHMHRAPKGRWLGLEAVQQYGDDGIGLTSAVLHDVYGPFGRSEQILTIRPMPR